MGLLGTEYSFHKNHAMIELCGVLTSERDEAEPKVVVLRRLEERICTSVEDSEAVWAARAHVDELTAEQERLIPSSWCSDTRPRVRCCCAGRT